ncbi:MAG: pyridoxal phosphate-dependent aminotransferase family protein [Candidatus Eisenbacteria bacterium]|nr:pyridoxal phosphate-dependent aminotransferase family protein [Candidatus Eisenbacteria bacterium]
MPQATKGDQVTTAKIADVFRKAKSFTKAAEARAAGLYPYFRAIQESHDTIVVIDGREMVMVGSNNYLGLTHDPRVLEAAEEASRRYGTGCTGSRFLNGTLDIHLELEAELAAFSGKQAAMMFSTGFFTNQGAIATLVGRSDVVIIDKLDHASIVEGCMLSMGQTERFKHNDLAELERILANLEPRKGRLIAVDGIFSMEGDIAPLPPILELCHKYGARLLVDEAHSTGVLGAHGAGTCEHFGVAAQTDVITATFSKSFASIGGYVAADADVIDYLRHHSRPFIFSAAMPPYAVATVRAALKIIREEPERRENLWKNARYMMENFRRLGFDIGGCETPIVPVITGDTHTTLVVWKQLFEEGVFTNPVVSPAVPENQCRIRTSYIATHTREQLDFVLDKFEKVGRRMGLIH